MLRAIAAALAFACAIESRASAQDPPAAEAHHAAAPPAWTWTADGSAFFGYNYQLRRYADYSAWESQNWFMLSGDRAVGSDRLSVHAMISLEPFTMRPRGSPQLFQTGESYERIPLVNFQHPHDLLIGLGATYRVVRPRATVVLGADLVGSPTLGPTAFMHRESARENPQVPLTHHYLDSTHITPGVLRAGVELGSLTLETSAFRGAGPDEDRLNIERPRLDSWAARVRWRRGPWQLQASGGHVRQPEWFEPYDATKLSASVTFDGSAWSRRLAATLAWGENRQFNGFNGNVDAYLLEWVLRATQSSTTYGRAEVASKELFGVGPHPKESAHPHWFSLVTALTVGYLRDLPVAALGRLGAGADVTIYRIPADLEAYYTPSRSFHVFLRWRPRDAAQAQHVH